MRFQIICLLSCVLYFKSVSAQKAVRYDLYISDTTVNYTGKKAKAIAVNGQTPGPTLYFTEGDTAEIYAHNLMDVETSIHWHGIILPNEQDGVSYLTTMPIKPHKTHLYKFPLVQNGTYMYHSHSGLQEQSGLHGALIIHKRNEPQPPMPEYVVLLSDWTNENPKEVLRSLKMENDWYSIEKHSTQNWGEAIMTGNIGTKARQEWLRMLPMDVSDVYYNKFLLNGQSEQQIPALKAGDKIKLRIINGSSSTYFWLQFAGGGMSVVASDGSDVSPVNVDRMIIGIAETYDVILTVPADIKYEFRATAEDRTGFSSLWLGEGMKMPAPTLPTLKYFKGMKMMDGMMKFNRNMDTTSMHMSMQQMDMNYVMYPELSSRGMNMPMDTMQKSNKGQNPVTLNYTMLRSPVRTTLPKAPVKTVYFKLTGNMNRYKWDINDLPISEADKISIKKGDNVRIIIYNATMMRHPMHLHGHFFRLLNGHGDYAPLKNVIDIMPMETDTIEFNANADGDWFFHCHILYHMMSGMGRVFSYENSKPNPQLQMDSTMMLTMKDPYKMFLMDDKMWFYSAGGSVQSQEISGNVMAINRYYQFDGMGVVNYQGSYMSETHFGRYIDKQQFLMLYVGSDIRDLKGLVNNGDITIPNYIENRKVAVLGIQYLLPFFIRFELRIDDMGRVRFQLSRNDFAITSRLRMEGMVNTDKEYEVRLRYILTKQISISVNYDNDFGAGGGITFMY